MAAASARDPRRDFDYAMDSDLAADSRWDSGQADDFRQRSLLVAPTVDAAEIVVAAAAGPGFAQTQLQRTERNRAP